MTYLVSTSSLTSLPILGKENKQVKPRMAKELEVNNEFITNEEGEEIVNPELSQSKASESSADAGELEEADEAEGSNSNSEEGEDSSSKTSEEAPEENTKGDEEKSKVESEEASSQAVSSGDELKPVAGETPRERALRLEVTRLKRESRDSRKNDLLKTEGSKEVKLDAAEDEALAQYDPNQLKDLEKILSKLGYAKKDEVISTVSKTTSDAILSEFLDKHPEYLIENDHDNILWNRFRSEFNLYKQPDSPQQFRQVLERAHRAVMGIATKTTPVSKTTIAAGQAKIKAVAQGGTTTSKGTKNSSSPLIDPSLTKYLKGFSKEDLQELYGV